MKKIITSFMAACLLFISVYPASVSAAGKNPSPALQALAAVMMNKAELFDTDNNKTVYLNNLLKYIIEYDPAAKADSFAVVDLDGDGTPEVVLSLDCHGGGYEVLRYANDKVFGYNLVFRAMQWLQKDGSFNCTGGADYNYTGKMRFLGTTWDLDDRAYEEGNSTYFDDVPIDEKTFSKYWLDENNEVNWQDFSKDNIMKWIINRPANLDIKPALPKTTIAARQKYLDGLADLVLLNSLSYSVGHDYSNANAEKYYKGWDAELNKIYKLLSKRLSAADMEKLRVSERQWIKNRDQRGNQSYILGT